VTGNGVTGKRVLVVEDEALIRLILAETLAEQRFEVIEAGTGDEAARLIDGPDGFDLLVTDIQMPGALDGIAVGAHARRRHADIPVIYVTGRPDSMARLGPAGPRDAIVFKPYGPRDVMAVIRRLMA
jgi:DNA-binding response OmpR family regulator